MRACSWVRLSCTADASNWRSMLRRWWAGRAIAFRSLFARTGGATQNTRRDSDLVRTCPSCLYCLNNSLIDCVNILNNNNAHARKNRFVDRGGWLTYTSSYLCYQIWIVSRRENIWRNLLFQLCRDTEPGVADASFQSLFEWCHLQKQMILFF